MRTKKEKKYIYIYILYYYIIFNFIQDIYI
jgi:hypothetical protein